MNQMENLASKRALCFKVVKISRNWTEFLLENQKSQLERERITNFNSVVP